MPRRTPLHRALLTLLAALALGLATLTVVQSTATSASAAGDPFSVRAGTTQLEVLGATTLEGAQLELLHGGAVVDTGTVDSQGSLVWRKLHAGFYTVRTTSPAPAFESAPARVTAFTAPPPAQSFYDGQTLTSGFNFIQTRDGTTLSANVVLPNPALFGPGPYPTVMEYSGYDPSNPRNTSFSTLMNGLGYAYVGVNIRGTGCSGGSFLPFEPLQSLDGYDAVETIAAQSFVKCGTVGLVGISYPGISQLYVARTQPPHLSAITPLSVLDDSYRATLWPGGILNTGFAVSWASQRFADSQPYGEGWEHDPDPAHPGANPTCDANQLVRLQNPDPVALISDNHFYNKAYYQQIDPSRFAHKINVPVYLGGAWQDEQTGGHFPDFIHRFTSSPAVYATMSNGGHVESLANLTSFNRYADFLSLYVAHAVPVTFFRDIAGPQLAGAITGIDGLRAVPGDTYAGLTYQQALKKYSSSGHIRIMFESGAAKGEPAGAPAARFEKTFTSWPIPGRKVTRYYLTARRRAVLQAGRDEGERHPGALVPRRPEGAAHDRLRPGERQHLGGPPDVPLEADPEGQGPRLGHLAAEAERGDDRHRLARRVGEDRGQGRRPRGDDHRRATQRQGGLRAERVAPGQPPRADREPLERHQAGARRHRRRASSRCRRTSTACCAWRSSRSPSRSGRATGSGSRWTHPATRVRRGRSTPSTTGRRSPWPPTRKHRSLLALNVVPGISVPAQAPACGDLRSQPCRTYRG